MPHLNWREADQGPDALVLSVETFAHSGARSGPRSAFSGREYELTIEMSAARRDALLERLREVLSSPEKSGAESGAGFGSGLGTELRLDLPREWIVFWKLREGESRILMAHPAEKQWVASINLEPSHALSLLRALAACVPGVPGAPGSPGGTVEIGALGTVGEVSNAEVRIRVV